MGKPPLQAVPRRLWLDAIATGMLAFGLIAGTALLGQEPPFPTPINFPAPSNPLGQFGAWISQSLLQAFGVSAFLGLFAWFSLLFGIYLRITPGAFLFRLFGWSLIIISASGLLDLWRSSLGAISEFGPGGKLAKVLEEWNFYSTLSGGEKQFACWILLVLGSLFSLTALWMGFFRGMGKLLSLLVFLIASGVRTIAWAFRLLVHRKPPAALKLATDTALAPEEQAPMPSAIELPGRDIIPIFHHGKQQGKAPQAKVESPSQSADSATAKKYQIPPPLSFGRPNTY